MLRLALTLSLSLTTAAAWSQELLTQCVDQCRLMSGPAGSAAHADCVARICMAAAPAPADPAAPAAPTPAPVPAPALAQPPGPIWLPDPERRVAEIRWQGRSLSYRCADGGGEVAISGLGGGGSALRFAVDGQIIATPFQTRDGIHYADAAPGSPLIEALMAGQQAVIVAGQVTLSLPLAGSRRAIAEVMAGCDRMG